MFVTLPPPSDKLVLERQKEWLKAYKRMDVQVYKGETKPLSTNPYTNPLPLLQVS
jgi:hypothetical protein